MGKRRREKSRRSEKHRSQEKVVDAMILGKYSRLGAIILCLEIAQVIVAGLRKDWFMLTIGIILGICAFKSSILPLMGAITGLIGIGFHLWDASENGTDLKDKDTWTTEEGWKDSNVWLSALGVVLSCILCLLFVALVIRSLIGICRNNRHNAITSKDISTDAVSSSDPSDVNVVEQRVVTGPAPSPPGPTTVINVHSGGTPPLHHLRAGTPYPQPPPPHPPVYQHPPYQQQQPQYAAVPQQQPQYGAVPPPQPQYDIGPPQPQYGGMPPHHQGPPPYPQHNLPHYDRTQQQPQQFGGPPPPYPPPRY